MVSVFCFIACILAKKQEKINIQMSSSYHETCLSRSLSLFFSLPVFCISEPSGSDCALIQFVLISHSYVIILFIPMRSAKRTIKDMQIIAMKRGGKCLSLEYVNSQTKLLWECKVGHRWEAIPNNIR